MRILLDEDVPTRLRLYFGEAADVETEVHSGDLVFAGIRVPVSTLVDYLKADHSIEEFLIDFPSVERWQIEWGLLIF